MKKVLTIAYYYPPYDSTAAVEASKLTKYLPRFGWDPIVVTATNDYPPSLPVEIDPSHVHRTSQLDVNRPLKVLAGRERVAQSGWVVDKSTGVGRAASVAGRMYRQLVNFPDGQIGWYPFSVRAARRLIRRYRPDAILSIAWPVTGHVIASRLKARAHIPWLADFRDLWTDNHHFHRARPLLGMERSLERRVMSRADAVSTPSDRWSEHVAGLYGVKGYTVPNGFDASDFPSDVPASERFTLTYTGVFYPGSQDISPLLEAMGRLKDDGLIDATNFRLRLVGRYLAQVGPLLEHFGVTDLTEIKPTVSHDEALRLQAESTALLFLLWNKPEGIGWYSAKVYEYLASRRPILAVGPNQGVAAELIESLEGCVVAADAVTVEKSLRGWVDEHNSSGRVPSVEEDIRRFEWTESASRLARALDDIL